MARHYPGLARGEHPGLGQIEQGGVVPAPPAPRVIAEDYFIYGIHFEDLTAGQTQNGFIQIEADSDFLIQKLAYSSWADEDNVTVFTQQVPKVQVTIVDTGSGRQLMNQPVPIGAFFGDGRLPYILPTPKLFTKNSRINVNVFNSGGDDIADLWIDFEGKKIFTSN